MTFNAFPITSVEVNIHETGRPVVKLKSKKDQLLGIAKELFAKNGYRNTSVKTICDKAQVNVSAISYYFGGKEELLIEIFENIAEVCFESAFKLLVDQTPATKKEFSSLIKLFIQFYVNYSTENKNYFGIFLLELRHTQNKKNLKSLMEKTSKPIFDLSDFFNYAKKKGIIANEINTITLAVSLLDLITSKVNMNFLHKSIFNQSIEDKTYKNQWCNEIFTIIFQGALKK